MKEKLKNMLPSLRRYAYSLTGSMPDADDLLQNTVERLLSKPLPEDVVLGAWAFRVCRNIWVDEHRSRKVRERATQDTALQEQVHDGEREVHSQMTLEKVHRAMELLKSEQRELIGLVAIEGFSYREVAESMGIPVGTVMSRLARARSALSQQLAL